MILAFYVFSNKLKNIDHIKELIMEVFLIKS